MTYLVKGPDLQSVPDVSLGEFFFECLERFHERICQTDVVTNRSDSYLEVKEKSVRVALELVKRGVKPQDVIVLCSRVTLDSLLPILAAFYVGAVVATFAPAPLKQTAHLLSLVTPKFIFAEVPMVPVIEKALESADLTSNVVVLGKLKNTLLFSEFLAPHENESCFKPDKIDSNDPAVIFFTSGSTGPPKPVSHTSTSFLTSSFSYHQSSDNYDVALSFSSYSSPSNMILTACLFLTGARRILTPLDPQSIFSAIQEYKINFLFVPPFYSKYLTEFENYEEFDTSSLRSVLLMGPQISQDLVQELQAIFKDSLVSQAYGITETGILTLFNPESEKDLIESKIESCGKVAPGKVLKVVDLVSSKDLGPYQKGEICAKWCCSMTKYYNSGSLEICDKDGYIKTGDVGYYEEDECFYVIQRVKETFRHKSHPVVPSVLEKILLQHPAVADAVVFGIPTYRKSEGELPTACVVLNDTHNVKREEIEEFVNRQVAEFERLRGGLYFTNQLLRTRTGVLMREEIRKVFLTFTSLRAATL